MNIVSKVGLFKLNSTTNSYMNKDNYVHWCIDTNDIKIAEQLISKVDFLHEKFDEFEHKSKHQIAKKLLDYKNDFWPEYDQNDPNLDWEAVDRGDFDVTQDDFVEKIKLLDLIIFENEIYSEFKDGGLFGGHRIHAKFTYDFVLISADV